jgi:heme/copper-type cytochrome/quinol oxidase subunit 2
MTNNTGRQSRSASQFGELGSLKQLSLVASKFKTAGENIDRLIWLAIDVTGTITVHVIAIVCISLLVIVAKVACNDIIAAIWPGNPVNQSIVVGWPLLFAIIIAISAYLWLSISSKDREKQTEDALNIDAMH